MPGRAPRQKGDRLERLAVDILQSYGLDAKRVPLSGAMRGYKGDVVVTINGQPLQLECKSRKAGFKLFYDAIEAGNCGLVLKTDREDPLICVPLRAFAALLAKVGEVKPPESRSTASRLLMPVMPPIHTYTAQEIGNLVNIAASPKTVRENLTSDEGGLDASPPDVSRET